MAELISSEDEGAGKPVNLQWDATGRMWTMTAFEYPMDANKGGKARAEAKYAAGGIDKILYFDNPYGPGPHTPRTFTSGLVIPLACLPLEGGKVVYSQYGTEIRKYIDDDGDGKADRHEVILKGMGIDDSTSFPTSLREPQEAGSTVLKVFSTTLLRAVQAISPLSMAPPEKLPSNETKRVSVPMVPCGKRHRRPQQHLGIGAEKQW